MKQVLLSVISSLMLVSCLSIDIDGGDTGKEDKDPSETPGTSETPLGYSLVWQDDFDAQTLDESVWNIEVTGNGGGNNELQYYRRENVTVGKEPSTGKSCLVLTARRESFGGKSFTSGRINSKGKKAFKYGRIEASVMLPKTANGLWPAFWMMGNDYDQNGWPRCGEIDILEIGNAGGIAAGTQDRYINGACHWGFYKDLGGGNWAYPNYAKFSTWDYSLQDGEFHLFTLVWDDQSLKMYVDLDKHPDCAPYYEMGITATDDDWGTGHYFHHDFFILFNLAVGGNFTGILDPQKVTALQTDASMYVDFVRVYQKQ